MIAATHKEKTLAIVHDTGCMAVPDTKYFDMTYWRSQQALSGVAAGRGNAWFINAPFGPVVLRQYLRGGWAARVSREQYFFTTVQSSRPFREFHILAALLELGLPVPRPVAALCIHKGFLSSGALLTATISGATTLADTLPGAGSRGVNIEAPWGSIGRCIRKFHKAGVWHADLNARNILLDSAQQVYLIDFDRARLTASKAINGEGNLNRLKRSLSKLWPVSDSQALHPAWEQLMAGYDE